jgi:hypothetical protein
MQEQQNWRDYAFYMGGKGRYWVTWLTTKEVHYIYATGKAAQRQIEELMQAGKLLNLREAV